MTCSRKPGRGRAAASRWGLLAAAVALPLLGGACAQRPTADGVAGPSAPEPVRLPPFPARGPVMLAGLG